MATFLSFGGGVQSCAIAALLLKGDDRMAYKPDLVLFADTGAEPDYIYSQVDTVFTQVPGALPPFFTCTKSKTGIPVLAERRAM